MPSAKHERLYMESVKSQMMRKKTGAQAAQQEKEAMAAEGGLINDRTGKATRKIRRRLGY